MPEHEPLEGRQKSARLLPFVVRYGKRDQFAIRRPPPVDIDPSYRYDVVGLATECLEPLLIIHVPLRRSREGLEPDLPE